MNNDLNQLSAKELGQLFPITISDYNSNWPKLFEQEKKQILKAIPENQIISIEHIGSTAIPRIKAKPTIDILIEVVAAFDKDQLITSMQEITYHHIPQPENPPPHMLFTKGYANDGYKGQAYHVHIRHKGNWDELVFRDYLRVKPKTAKAYELLKLKLAKLHKNNREDYTKGKTAFIKQVMAKARK